MTKPISKSAKKCFLPHKRARRKVCLVNNSRVDVTFPKNSYHLSKAELHYSKISRQKIQRQGGLNDAALKRIRLFFGTGKKKRTVEVKKSHVLFIPFIHIAAALGLKSSFPQPSQKQFTSTLRYLMIAMDVLTNGHPVIRALVPKTPAIPFSSKPLKPQSW